MDVVRRRCTLPIRVRCVLWPDGRVGGLQGAASFLEHLWLASESSGEHKYSSRTVFMVHRHWGVRRGGATRPEPLPLLAREMARPSLLRESPLWSDRATIVGIRGSEL